MSAAVVACACALSLSACEFSANAGYFVEPDDLGKDVGALLASEIGSATPPDIDCGDDRIYLSEGKEVDCKLSVQGEPGYYDVVVTLTDVHGKDFLFDVSVGGERQGVSS